MSDSDFSSDEDQWTSSSSSSSASSNSDDELMELLIGAAQDCIELANRPKVPCQTSALTGAMYAREVYEGSPADSVSESLGAMDGASESE
ncbi:hypothetical protein DFH28DRAFT_1132327 [Melampsora americana]|nr:hypothetical protein DFH28DRAFT_1132327 [Melampsora americana]